MSHTQIIEKGVNIDSFPLVDQNAKAEAGTRITEGDFHGNAQKLNYILKRHGFINISKNDYEAFAKIYRKEKITARDKADFDAIIDRISIMPEALLSLLLSIGDFTSDRGMNDYFTLKLLKKLIDNKVPFLNLIANHDAEFIKSYEKIGRFDESLLIGGQSRSACNLQKLLDAGMVSKREIKELIDAYKASLRVLDYSLNETNDKITIYSHGVIGLESINYIAAALGIKNAQCDEKTPASQIAEIIEEINEKFAVHVKNNTVTDLINLDNLSFDELNGKKPINPQKFPFAYLIWNRDFSNVNRPKHIHFVHGHDQRDKTCENVTNLDNILGKTPNHHTGEYHALYSHETKLPLKLKKEETAVLNDDVIENKKPSLLPYSIIEDYQHITENSVEKLQEELEEELEKDWIELEDAEINVIPEKADNTFLGYLSPITNTAKSWFWSSNSTKKEEAPKFNLEGVEFVGKYGKPLTGNLSESCIGIPVANKMPETSMQQTREVVGKYGKPFTGDLSQSISLMEKKAEEREEIKEPVFTRVRGFK